VHLVGYFHSCITMHGFMNVKSWTQSHALCILLLMGTGRHFASSSHYPPIGLEYSVLPKTCTQKAGCRPVIKTEGYRLHCHFVYHKSRMKYPGIQPLRSWRLIAQRRCVNMMGMYIQLLVVCGSAYSRRVEPTHNA
jgi:hypothetical protein